jgi:hypothetical protein
LAIETPWTAVFCVVGVPVQGGVDVVEQARAHQIDLARTTLLGRRAVDAQFALDVVLDHPLLERDGRADRGRAEQVVAAAVAGDLARNAGLHRVMGLGQARQGVELGEDGDDGAGAVLEAGDEGGRHAGHAGLYLEAGGLQLLLQHGRALGLLVADLGEAPDLQRGVLRSAARRRRRS